RETGPLLAWVELPQAAINDDKPTTRANAAAAQRGVARPPCGPGTVRAELASWTSAWRRRCGRNTAGSPGTTSSGNDFGKSEWIARNYPYAGRAAQQRDRRLWWSDGPQ